MERYFITMHNLIGVNLRGKKNIQFFKKRNQKAKLNSHMRF